MSKFFPVSQKNIFPVSQNFSLCQSKIPCVKAKFPVFSLSGKSENQIPCFPCAVATLPRSPLKRWRPFFPETRAYGSDVCCGETNCVFNALSWICSKWNISKLLIFTTENSCSTNSCVNNAYALGTFSHSATHFQSIHFTNEYTTKVSPFCKLGF